MKIERDKTYLNRLGAKVLVVYVGAVGGQPVVGVFDSGEAANYDLDGQFMCEATSQFDLVSEYVEPPKPRECWVRKFEDGSLGSVCWEYLAQAGELPNSKLVLFREVIA